VLEAWQVELLLGARRATLATIRRDGTPRLVPCCFAVLDLEDSDGLRVVVPLDEKPKAVADPRRLARVRDIGRDPRVELLVDRWSEEWAELAWLRLAGRASLIEPGGQEASEHARALVRLRGRYPQYRSQALESRPVIRIAVERVTGWRGSG
jgi:PPOX class probable F420-dependent enzyme